MDQAINSALIIMGFAVAHERILEFARWIMEQLPRALRWLRNTIDWLTAGPGAILPAVALAFLTRANLLDLFAASKPHDNGEKPLFVDTFMRDVSWDAREIIGCALMGLAISFGATFWHDLAKGLVDVRAKVQAATRPRLPGPPAGPQTDLIQDGD